MPFDDENTVESAVNDVAIADYEEAHQTTRLLRNASLDDDDSHLKASSLNILIALGLYIFGQALLIAAGVDAMTELICDDHYGEASPGAPNPLKDRIDPRCRSPEISGLVAGFSAQRMIILGVLGVIMTPRLSSLSDRFGRKPLMIWAGFTAILAETVSLSCIIYPNRVNYRWLLLAAVFQGIGGSVGTIQLLNSNYIVDCVPVHDRAKMLGRLDSVLFGCLALGPLIGSILLKRFDSLVLLYQIALACSVLFLLIIVFTLHESRSLKARRMSQAAYDEEILSETYNEDASMKDKLNSWRKSLVRRINIVKPIRVILFLHIKNDVRRRNARIIVLLACFGLELALSIASILLLYSEMRYKWTSVQTGLLMTTVGTWRMILLAILYPLVLNFLRRHLGSSTENVDRSDLVMVKIGILIHVIGYLCMGYSPTGLAFAASSVFESCGSILSPTLKNVLVKYADRGNVGELLGSLSLLNSLISTVVPILFLTIYRHTVSNMPNAVFLIAGAGFLCLWALTFVVDTSLATRESNEESETNHEGETYGAI